MSTTTISPQSVYQDALVNYLVSMARAVETTVGRAMRALLERDVSLASQVLLNEPRINEMEIIIDEQAVRLLRAKELGEERIRLIVATLKINNDLERMGDLAQNIAARAQELGRHPPIRLPAEFATMVETVRTMVRGALDALVDSDVQIARRVLAADQTVDRIHQQMFLEMKEVARQNPDNMEAPISVLSASRNLERIADQCTNIAEDVIFMVEGEIVRHRRRR